MPRHRRIAVPFLALCLALGASLALGAPPVSGDEEPAAPKPAQPDKGAPKSKVPAHLKDVAVPKDLPWAREVIARAAPGAQRVEEFPVPRDWLNVSRPLTFGKELKGKVVILDFWCYCCINCIHVLPDLEFLEKKYKDQAFAVVGVHSAKFENERDVDNIREAVRRYEIHHPVVNDFDFTIWKRFGARAWPTFVVVTPEGTVLGRLSGEGHRDELDALVYALLEREDQRAHLDTTPLPIRLEQSARTPSDLAYPGKVLADAKSDRLYVADSNHNRILELKRDGTFLRAFGDGARGWVDGPATKARFFRPQGMALRDGKLQVADTENHAIREIDLATGQVTTLAGVGKQGYLRQGAHPALEAKLSSPWALAWIQGNLHIAMAGTHQLWTYDPKHKEVERFAGDGTEQRLDHGSLTSAAFAQPSGYAWDGKWLYVADSESSSIVRVGMAGPVQTLAGANPARPRDLFHFGDEDGKGPGRRFQHALGVAVADDGKFPHVLFVADSYNHKLKRVDTRTGEVTSWLGDPLSGFSDKPAKFSEPGGLSYAAGTLYVADTNNHAIRVVDIAKGEVTTLKLKGVPIPQAQAKLGGAGDAWPVLPGTEAVNVGNVAVASGKPATLTLKLRLPIGWKLTPDAPSAYRVEGLPSVTKGPLLGTETTLPVPALEPGRHTLTVRLIYYVCQEELSCRMKSVDFKLILDARADGPTTAEVVDTFVP